MAEVIIGLSSLNRRLNAIGNPTAMQRLLGKIAKNAVDAEAAMAPKKTGNLKRSIHVGAVTPTTAALVASANYAAYQEYGTGLYGPRHRKIVPVNKKALAFHSQAAGIARFGVKYRLSGNMTVGSLRKFGPGADFVVVRSVKGSPAHPFMVPGARKALEGSPLVAVVIQAWNDAA